ncbi:hypothetical protein SAMN05443270_0084 [Lacrimispora sphenoides]|jgi:hypothetical protein|nr:hypothetical protein SAMN05443270_0084 [Lacrimispora sphenoides]
MNGINVVMYVALFYKYGRLVGFSILSSELYRKTLLTINKNKSKFIFYNLAQSFAIYYFFI